MMRLDPDQLAALSAAVAEGTFDAAARALHVTPLAISQRIRALENATGRVLLTRSKPIVPTDAGVALLRLSRQLDVLTAEALAEAGAEASGQVTVPVAVNADSLATWFPDVFGRLAAATLLDVHRADQDRTADLLRAGTAMAAVTSAPLAVPGCEVFRLGRMVYRAAASPGFVRRWFPDGPTAAALAVAPVVVYDRSDALQDVYLRRRTRRAPAPPRHHVPDSHAFVRAVRAGLGWGMIPDQQRAGSRLVDVDPDAAVPVTLHWQRWRVESSALEDLTAAVRVVASGALS